MKALLWLDDIRDPQDNIWLSWMIDAGINPVEFNITWVKSYDEFTKWIKKNGLPGLICFDHDLGEDVAKGRVSKGMSKRQARILKRETLSGFDCAKWLIEFCLDNELNAPEFKIQSANPVGAENIKGLIENFRNNVKF
jgi:hypothetical protein